MAIRTEPDPTLETEAEETGPEMAKPMSEEPETTTVSLDMLPGNCKPGEKVSFTVVSISNEDGTATLKPTGEGYKDGGGIKGAVKAFESMDRGAAA